jgi:hypothetical protein
MLSEQDEPITNPDLLETHRPDLGEEYLYRGWCANCLRYYDRELEIEAETAISKHISRITFYNGKHCDDDDVRITCIPKSEYQDVLRGWAKVKADALKKYNITEEDFSPRRDVKRGNDEIAYWLKHTPNSRPEEIYIGVMLKYYQCPNYNCEYRVYHQDCEEEVEDPKATFGYRYIHINKNAKRNESEVYHEIFEHYISLHYDRTKTEHSEFSNLCFAIIQELVKYEARVNSGSPRKTVNSRCEVVYTLNNKLGLPIGLIGEILRITDARKLYEMSYRGMIVKEGDIPDWAKRVYTTLEAEKK